MNSEGFSANAGNCIIMSIPYGRVEKAFRGAGLRTFSKRKLQRWAEPVVEVPGPDGTLQRLGLLSGGKRRGKGRGAGVNWTLSKADFLTAAFIQYALDRMENRTLGRLGGHTLGDAGLWAFLWGAPIPLPVVRYYLLESLDRTEQQVMRRLESQREYQDDELDNLIERLARHMGYDHPVLKTAGVPVADRQRLGQEALSAWVGKRWEGEIEESSLFYTRITETHLKAIARLLAGDGGVNTEQFFDPLPPSQVEEELSFYSFAHLRELYRECPKEWLDVIQETFSERQRFLDAVSDAIRKKREVPDAIMQQAKDLRALHTMLSRLSPETAVGLMLWGVSRRHGKEDPNPA